MRGYNIGIEMRGSPTHNDYIAHAHSEISEVFQAEKHKEGRREKLEEITDAILSTMTSHAWHFANEELILQLKHDAPGNLKTE